MRVRDHVAISSAGAAVLYPVFGRRVFAAWAGSVLIDVDHYLWFVIHERSLNPLKAVRFFNQAKAPAENTIRVLHSPVAISLAFLLAARRRALLPVAFGMAAHAALDLFHEARLRQPRAAALQRDNFTCQACGAQGVEVVAHLERQPRLLPSYDASNHRVLCTSCHEAAHARRSSFRWRSASAVAALLAWRLTRS